MGLDVGFTITQIDEQTAVDLPELTEYLTEALFETIGHTDGRYCLPHVYRGDKPGEIDVSVRICRWGMPLSESGYRVGDLLRVLMKAALDRFDPEDGLRVESW
jgi:hypothetical protein